MFDKWKEHRRLTKEKRQLTNEVMQKLLKYLDNPNAWLYNGEREYKHVETDIVIEWGDEGCYDDVIKHRKIQKPIRQVIPRRFRNEVYDKLQMIVERDRSPDDLTFFKDYMDGLYKQKLEIDRKQISEITIWMIENKITEWHIISNLIWFKNEEDTMAVKLRWMG